MDSKLWHAAPAAVTDFASEWGSPYGSRRAQLAPGDAVEIDVVCTDLSVAYVDTPGGGNLRLLVDGVERLLQPTNVPFVDLEKQERFMENRKGVLGLGFGLHRVRIEAAEGPVSLLGVFTYDSDRAPSASAASPTARQQTVPSLPFPRPAAGHLPRRPTVNPEDIGRDKVTAGGEETDCSK